ncbi:hypothetical protein [Streptosporangium sp. NPDC006930]|uniref:hypothetical protein n=1 Tax=unclassified Streptosporangium TaxID=2632669 RepID=UPI00342D16B4
MKIVAPERRLRHVKAQAVRAADRVGPMASHARDAASQHAHDVALQARDVAGQAREMAGQAREAAGQARGVASEKIIVARGWAAPRLDAAAHSIEEQLAPRLSAALSQAAARIDPTPVKSRKTPMFLLFTGIAIAAAGYVLYRKNADQWADTLKESASDASQWVGQKTEAVAGKASGAVDDAVKKAEEVGAKVTDKAADTKAEHASHTSQTPKRTP